MDEQRTITVNDGGHVMTTPGSKLCGAVRRVGQRGGARPPAAHRDSFGAGETISAQAGDGGPRAIYHA
jgi:hypothetical protein